MLRFLLLCFFASTLAAASEIYHHDLLNYPNSGTCHAESGVLADRLSKETGAEIYWAGVTKESKTGCDIRISYIAEAPVEFESSVDSGISASIRKGTHTSFAQCRASLPKEIEIFERATRLKAWVSYCYHRDGFLDPYPFVSHVEGIGKGEHRVFGADTIVPVRPARGWGDVETQIAGHLGLLDVLLASIRLRPHISADDKELTVRFYGKERLWLSSARYSKHTNPKDCDVQIDNLRKGLMTAKIPPVAVYCGQYSHREYWVNLIGLSTNIFGVGNMDGFLDPKTFSSLEACTSATPAILKFYREKLGKNALAAICGDGAGPFQPTVFSEKK